MVDGPHPVHGENRLATHVVTRAGDCLTRLGGLKYFFHLFSLSHATVS